MNELELLVSGLLTAAENPIETIKREVEITGREAAGCFLGFGPEELIDAAGFLPVGIWGEEREIEKAKQYYPAFFCAPIQRVLEQGMRGEYDGLLKAMVMPVYCDALRSAGQNFKTAVPYIPVISVVFPANRKLDSGKRFLAGEYRNAGRQLSEIGEEKITEEKLKESIAVYNRYRQAMRGFVEEASLHPELMTPYRRHMIIKASCFMDKRRYTEKIIRLTALMRQREQTAWEGKNVILTGIFLESELLLKKMENLKLTVVSDFLLQESLQFQTDVREGEDLFYSLAGRFGDMNFCPVALDPEKTRIGRLCREAKEKQAGIIVCIPSFCDPEEYDYPLLKREFERQGIHHICLELNTSSASSQAETLLQTFAEL